MKIPTYVTPALQERGKGERGRTDRAIFPFAEEKGREYNKGKVLKLLAGLHIREKGIQEEGNRGAVIKDKGPAMSFPFCTPSPYGREEGEKRRVVGTFVLW